MLFKLSKINFFSIKDLICTIIIFLIFTLDRFSKIKIIESQKNEGAIYINDFLNFELAWNTGIGFGLLSFNADFLYHLISAIIISIVSIIIFLMFAAKNIEKYFYSFILGGALGNLFDRLTYFAVPDFIDLHFQNYHWFTFNIADIFITVGIILILFRELLAKNYEKN
jgi:signal peptidase II|tara:strand:- start:1066 stop:1569 length:504 start_codon:yes stop_codon:yes gene_type:complete